MSRQAVKVEFGVHVEAAVPVPPASFRRRASALMAAFMDLEARNADLADLADLIVNTDVGSSVMEVEILIFTDDPITALENASAILRIALHTASVQTPEPPTARTTTISGAPAPLTTF